MKRLILMVALILLNGVPCVCSAASASSKAIALVFFGTTVESGLKVYDAIESDVKRRYPQYSVYRAFTSQVVIRKLKEKGRAVPDMKQMFAEIRKQGIGEVYVMPMLIAPGQEYGKIVAAANGEPDLKIRIAAPLMNDAADIRLVAAALERNIVAGETTVIVCHGNEKQPQYNREIIHLAEYFKASNPHVMVAAVEGDNPGKAPLQKAKALAARSGSVHFIPLMLVAGDHVINDIMGDEPDSWKKVVGAAKTRCSGPVGLNSHVMAIFYGHLDQVIARGAGQAGGVL